MVAQECVKHFLIVCSNYDYKDNFVPRVATRDDEHVLCVIKVFLFNAFSLLCLSLLKLETDLCLSNLAMH